MKKWLQFLMGCLMFQTVCCFSGKLNAQTVVVDSLFWSWEVTSTASTKTKTCTLAFSDSLHVDWGDGVSEWMDDSLSTKVLTHVYATAGNYACTVAGKSVTYFKADSRRLLTFSPQKAPNLTYLSFTSSQVKTLNVSANQKLETLYCGSNSLTTLDLSSNKLLATLTCSDNQLTQLDVSTLPLLKKLTCHTNPLASINVHPSGALSYVACNQCSLSASGLDSLFEQLPTLTSLPSSQNLNMLNNPGSADCHAEIAAVKNWLLGTVVTKSAFYVPAVSSKMKDTALVTVCLKTLKPAVAFELDVLLPDGVRLDTVKSCLASARKGSHVLTIARMSDSTQLYKFMAYSLKSKDTLMGNDGAVLHLYLTVPDTVRSYTIDLKKAVLVDTSATAADITLTDGKLSILPVYYIGDSDGDEQVNVTDIVWLVAWINGKNPDGFQKEAADMDGNGSWNVVDVVKLVDLINATVSSSKVAVRRTETDDAKVYNAKAAGKTNHVYLCQSETDAATVDLCLDNIDGVQALQVDMVLSSGIAVETSTAELLSDRSDGHVISFKCVSAAENRYRLLVWSLRTDNPLKGNTGPVVRFKVQTSSEKETDTLTGKLQDAVLTGMDRKAVNSETYMTKLDFSTTGGQLLAKAGSDAKGRLWVSGDKLKEIGVYDLAGRLSAKVIDPEEELIYLPVSAGVYLVRVKQEGQSLSVMKVLVP